MQEKRKEMRKMFLGDDVEVLSCRYIDTSHGFVMTQPKVMALVGAKSKADTDKREHKERIRLQRETSAARLGNINTLEG